MTAAADEQGDSRDAMKTVRVAIQLGDGRGEAEAERAGRIAGRLDPTPNELMSDSKIPRAAEAPTMRQRGERNWPSGKRSGMNVSRAPVQH